MEEKNKGWEFLNSEDNHSHNDDTSWGYKNDDGSGSFYDDDGSWGYRTSNGKVSYYGADGSWGYKNEDGSGSYYGGDNNTTHYDPEEDESEDSSVGETIAKVIGAGVAEFISVREQAASIERERERRRQNAILAEKRKVEKEKTERRKAWRKKHRKGIAFSIIMILVILLSLVGYIEYQKLIPVGFSNVELEGIEYRVVVDRLRNAGFTNIITKEVSDLSIARENEKNLVTDINLGFIKTFDSTFEYPSNLWITVIYHTVKLHNPPITSKDAKGSNYLEIVEMFESAGYTNIKTVIEYDIVTGWLTKDGEVKSVTINQEDYDIYDEFRLDSEVVITYHTYRKNKPK